MARPDIMQLLFGAQSGNPPIGGTPIIPNAGLTAVNQLGQRQTVGQFPSDAPLRQPAMQYQSPLLQNAMRQSGSLPFQQTPQPETPAQPPMSMLDKIRTGLGAPSSSPMGMAINQASQALLQQSGYSPVPRTTGEIIGNALGAANQGFMAGKVLEQQTKQAAFDRRMELRKLANERLKIQSDFDKDALGRSATERAYNRIINYNPDTANKAQQQQYAFDINQLSKPQTSIDSATGDTVTIPGMDFEAIGVAPPVGGFPKPTTTENFKATQDQANATGFADRMKFAENQITNLSNQGFDVPSLKEILAYKAGANVFVSPQARGYFNNALNFITAQLRRESGAVISDSEFANSYELYFPSYGDDVNTIAQKKQLRDTALNSMIGSAGEAYGLLERPEIRIGSEAYPIIYYSTDAFENDFINGTLRSGDVVIIDGVSQTIGEQ